jgi:hypothetical protein
MPDELRLGCRMLAFRQPGEVLCSNRPFQTPLLGEFPLPFTMTLLVPAPVIRLLGGKLAGMVRPGLAAENRFGDRQHGYTPETSAVPK